MDPIYWILCVLAFTMVGIGLRFAHNFANSEEKKNRVHKMALIWKAQMEENSTR